MKEFNVAIGYGPTEFFREFKLHKYFLRYFLFLCVSELFGWEWYWYYCLHIFIYVIECILDIISFLIKPMISSNFIQVITTNKSNAAIYQVLREGLH